MPPLEATKEQNKFIYQIRQVVKPIGTYFGKIQSGGGNLPYKEDDGGARHTFYRVRPEKVHSRSFCGSFYGINLEKIAGDYVLL